MLAEMPIDCGWSACVGALIAGRCTSKLAPMYGAICEVIASTRIAKMPCTIAGHAFAIVVQRGAAYSLRQQQLGDA